MTLLWAIVGTASAICAIFSAYTTGRVWRANKASYETNQAVTGGFVSAATGRVASLVNSDHTDFRINHFVDPCVTNDGCVAWERAASLSDEAVDGVLARH